MGLDMYLNKKRYMGWNYEHNRENKRVPDLSDFNVDTKKVTYIEEQALYWRKANAIHQWFVENVQGGCDDCKSYFVGKDDLEKLLTLVTEVLDDHEKAETVLPTTSGFFFGNTEYDEWYFKDLEYTKEGIETLLANWDIETEYYYQSSW